MRPTARRAPSLRPAAVRTDPYQRPCTLCGTRGDCARSGGSGLCDRQLRSTSKVLRNTGRWSPGRWVGGELVDGAAAGGDGGDAEDDEGDGVASARARELPAADVEEADKEALTSSGSAGKVEGGATAAGAPTDSVMMVDLAAAARVGAQGPRRPRRQRRREGQHRGNTRCCSTHRGRTGRSPRADADAVRAHRRLHPDRHHSLGIRMFLCVNSPQV